MKPVPHKKRQLASKAVSIIAKRRAKWLATQRGETALSKADIAAGRQFAESFLNAVITNPFWLKTIEDIATSMQQFVKLAERQGAPAIPPANAQKVTVEISPDKIAIVEQGLRTVAKLHGKDKARRLFIEANVPVRAPGSATFIHGWVGSSNASDLVTEFWSQPAEAINQIVSNVVQKAKALQPKAALFTIPKAVPTESKENAVNGIEAPPRKRIYSPEDFMPSSDDMIGLAQSAPQQQQAQPKRARARAISKPKYESLVSRLAHQIAARRKRKPGPVEFALAKKRLDARMHRVQVGIVGGMRMGVSDIMGAAYLLGAAAKGSQAAKAAISKSVEAAKEGDAKGKKQVAALQIAKKMRTKSASKNRLRGRGRQARPQPQKQNRDAVRQQRLLRSFYKSPYPSHPAFKIHD